MRKIVYVIIIVSLMLVPVGVLAGSSPSVDLVKNASPTSMLEPGGAFQFTLTITNTSPVTVTIIDLTDTQSGATDFSDCEALIGTTLAPGASTSCTYSVTHTQAGQYDNTANVTVVDSNKNTASDKDDETVWVYPLFKQYLPIIGSSSGCQLLGSFGVTVGYEDLQRLGSNDYDYNDWITDIRGTLDFNNLTTCGLNRMDLVFTPQARGAVYTHAFHMLFPANTFGSDGTATLTIYDQDGAVLSSDVMPFTASVANDFEIFSHTSDVFPSMTNTREGTALLPPARTASLSIDFSTTLPFVAPSNALDFPHGEGLFFDPYIVVLNTSDEVHVGDVRLLAVPEASYMWPEERRRIDTVYEGIEFIPGNPPTINFVSNWWELPHNDCVYGDGVVCSLP